MRVDGCQKMKRVYSLKTIWAAVAVATFIASEIATACATAIWATAGLMKLGLAGTMVLSAVLGIPSLLLIARVCFLAWEAETDPANL